MEVTMPTDRSDCEVYIQLSHGYRKYKSQNLTLQTMWRSIQQWEMLWTMQQGVCEGNRKVGLTVSLEETYVLVTGRHLTPRDILLVQADGRVGIMDNFTYLGSNNGEIRKEVTLCYQKLLMSAETNFPESQTSCWDQEGGVQNKSNLSAALWRLRQSRQEGEKAEWFPLSLHQSYHGSIKTPKVEKQIHIKRTSSSHLYERDNVKSPSEVSTLMVGTFGVNGGS